MDQNYEVKLLKEELNKWVELGIVQDKRIDDLKAELEALTKQCNGVQDAFAEKKIECLRAAIVEKDAAMDMNPRGIGFTMTEWKRWSKARKAGHE